MIYADRTLRFSPDSRLLYTAPIGTDEVPISSAERTEIVSVISVPDGKHLRTLKFPWDNPNSRAMAASFDLSADGGRLYAIPGTTGNVVVYDTSTGTIERQYNIPEIDREVGKMRFSSRVILDETRNRFWVFHTAALRSFELATGQELSRLQVFSLDVVSAAMDKRTGAIFAGGSSAIQQSRYPANSDNFRTYRDDPSTLIRQVSPDGATIQKSFSGPGGTIDGLDIHPSGALLVALRGGGSPRSELHLSFWDRATGQLLADQRLPYTVGGRDAVFSPNGAYLAHSVANDILIHEVHAAGAATLP